MRSTGAVSLRWRAASSSASVALSLLPTPEQNRGFTEATSYVFEKPALGWSFRIDDEPLDDEPGDRTLWRWKPKFFAGEVTAELLDPNGFVSSLFLLDVAPEPTKVGRQMFEQMLGELWSADPTLVIGSEPGERAIGDLGTTENPWLEFSRFRRYVPDFLRAIISLRANPHRVLAVRRIAVPLHQVRRVDRRTATALAQSPTVVALLGKSTSEMIGAQSSKLDVPFAEETVDSAANRAMLALLLALIRRGSKLHERLQDLVSREPDNETRTSLATRWPRRRQILDELLVHLKGLLHQSPFSKVTRPEISAAALTTVASDPRYARAWGRGWRALRHGLEFGSSVERLWVSPSWEIYERWCFLRLGQLLTLMLPNWHWKRFADRWIGLATGSRAELCLQPTFRSRPEESQRMWSISRERVPDIVLTVESGDGIRFFVLDAKYRSSRSNVLEAMASAHIYQDSLRIGSRRPEASLLLVPSGGGAPWLEATEFQLAHHVGVHVLSPDTSEPLPKVLKGMFDSVKTH